MMFEIDVDYCMWGYCVFVLEFVVICDVVY